MSSPSSLSCVFQFSKTAYPPFFTEQQHKQHIQFSPIYVHAHTRVAVQSSILTAHIYGPMAKRVLIAAATTGGALATPNGLSRTPPAGWMSWQTFRCATNCTAAPTACINEDLYRAQADALISTGLAAAGFSSVHLDDCIMAPERDRTTHELLADPVRFPSGFQALGTYFHERNLTFAMYTAESDTTCAGLPGSRGFEALDARTFAGWGADYLKADGCGDPTYYAQGYAAMGAALQATGRPIEFSCSWPAYLGSDETQKPFGAMVGDGCNLWRNYIDMGPTVGVSESASDGLGLAVCR